MVVTRVFRDRVLLQGDGQTHAPKGLPSQVRDSLICQKCQTVNNSRLIALFTEHEMICFNLVLHHCQGEV